MGDLTKHFSRWEFECGCNCGLVILDKRLTARLSVARVRADIPFVINSGTRCSPHNKAVGGVANSSHLTGKAVDIHAMNFTERYRILEGLFYAGFRRIKISRTFIHVDVDENKVQEWCGI